MRLLSRWLVRDSLLRRLALGLGSLRTARNELRWMRQELPAARMREAVRLRARYKYPLQYILGSQPFGSIDIKCAPGVLIPRWETEEWVSQLAATLRPGTRILDLCTGTGCVLFGLCELVPAASGAAADINERAIELFEENQRELGMQDRTRVCVHDLFRPLPAELRSIDCVVANPPYISDLALADYSVREHEPQEALIEPEGIWRALVERVMETTATVAVFEVGSKRQIDECRELFTQHGWTCEGRRDSQGNWRTAWAARP